MIVNLKQINLSDSDNIKLDKINYNFDQLVANGGGPMGTTGPVGAQGATGITGAQGYQGPIGPTGIVGAPGSNTTAYWKNTAGGGNVPVDTILPIHDPLSNLHAPVVSVGFMGGDAEYGAGQSTSPGQTPYQWIINRKSNFAHNLRFTSSDVLNNSFNFKMENLGTINTFTMGFQTVAPNIPTSIIWHAQNHIFIDNTTGSPLLEVGTSGITYHKDVEFDRPVAVNGPLKIGNANAAQDKIAVAADNNGTVTFKSIDELGGIVPYGTIVSILPSVFNNPNNFIINETVTLADASDLLKIGVGRGINDYSGWYICNGETWKSDSVSPQLVELTPNLNSFSYTIEDNPDSISLTSQGSVNSPNTDVHIVGGSDISMSASYGGPGGLAGMYTVTSTVTDSDVPVTTYTGSTFKIKKLPQIIYLGVDDAYWQKPGTGQAPFTNNDVYVDDLNNTTSGSHTASVVTHEQQGTYNTVTITVNAADGYYFSSIPNATELVPQNQGVSIVSIPQAGNGAQPTTFSFMVGVTQGIDGTQRWIHWNSSTHVSQIPSFQLNIDRFTSVDNATMLPLDPDVITYNMAGTTFDMVITADSSYLFNSPNDITFTNGTSPSPSTFTINSATFTGANVGYTNERQITINVTLSGVPYGTNTVYYGLQGDPVLQGPLVSLTVLNVGGIYPLSNSSQTSPSVSIENNSANTIYIRSYAISYVSALTNFVTASGYGSLPVSTTGGSNTTYSSNVVSIGPNGTWSGTLSYSSGYNSSFVAGFVWSTTSVGPWTTL